MLYYCLLTLSWVKVTEASYTASYTEASNCTVVASSGRIQTLHVAVEHQAKEDAAIHIQI